MTDLTATIARLRLWAAFQRPDHAPAVDALQLAAECARLQERVGVLEEALAEVDQCGECEDCTELARAEVEELRWEVLEAVAEAVAGVLAPIPGAPDLARIPDGFRELAAELRRRVSALEGRSGADELP